MKCPCIGKDVKISVDGKEVAAIRCEKGECSIKCTEEGKKFCKDCC